MARGFMLEEDARIYFKRIDQHSRTGKIPRMLQSYWLCALAGLIEGRKESPVDAHEVVAYFVPPLDGYQHHIRAFLFWRYADELGYRRSDEKDIVTGLNQVFDQESQSKLTDTAIAELDRYAAEGFRRIRAHITEPTDLATFLVDYVDLLSKLEKGL